jgi:hypothetical protein
MRSNPLFVALAFPDDLETSTILILITRTVCLSSCLEREFSVVPSGPYSCYVEVNITSLIEPYNGVVTSFSTDLSTGNLGPAVAGYDFGFQFGGEKARKEDPPNNHCELAYDAVL